MLGWVRLGGQVDTTPLLPRCVAAGVAYVPGAPFYVGAPDRSTQRLSFATHPPQTITTGLKHLAVTFGWSARC